MLCLSKQLWEWKMAIHQPLPLFATSRSVSSVFPFIDRRHFLSADVRKCVSGPQPDIVRNGTALVLLLLPRLFSSDEPQEVMRPHLSANGCYHLLSGSDRSLRDYLESRVCHHNLSCFVKLILHWMHKKQNTHEWNNYNDAFRDLSPHMTPANT